MDVSDITERIKPFRDFFSDVNVIVQANRGDVDEGRYIRGYYVNYEDHYVLIADFNKNGLFCDFDYPDTKVHVHHDGTYLVRLTAAWVGICKIRMGYVFG